MRYRKNIDPKVTPMQLQDYKEIKHNLLAELAKKICK